MCLITVADTEQSTTTRPSKASLVGFSQPPRYGVFSSHFLGIILIVPDNLKKHLWKSNIEGPIHFLSNKVTELGWDALYRIPATGQLGVAHLTSNKHSKINNNWSLPYV